MSFEFTLLDALQALRCPVLDALAVFFDQAGAHGEIWIAFTAVLLAAVMSVSYSFTSEGAKPASAVQFAGQELEPNGWCWQVPLLGGVLTALADETIQIYSPGRSSQVTDVWLDSAGVLAGILAALVLMALCGLLFHHRNKE